ncbi:MAG: tripartite tricarboxylate transporter TctB family protein [Spirochaetales bacterium]|nr:MAG: tripartite tricarboxylate transporter TctB family protein [Spirochaetales bacterium]
MTERTKIKADLVTSVILIVFSTAITVNSLGMPTMVDRNESPFSGPGVVPAFIGAMLFFLGTFMLVRSLRQGAYRFIVEDRGKPGGSERASWMRIARTIVLCVLYALLLGKVWFPIITFLFVFIFIMMFEYDFKAPVAGQWKISIFAAFIALATAASVFFVFQYLFLVNLP